MVSRRLAAVVAAAAAAAFAFAPAAQAKIHFPSPPGSGGGGGGGTTTGQGGAAQHTATGHCQIYSNASGYGLSCLGTSGGTAPPVKKLLHGDPVPVCWDERISSDDAQRKFQLNLADGPYFMHVCLSGLDVEHSIFDQPGLQLAEQIINIDHPDQICPKPYDEKQTGVCVITLTQNQQNVVSYVESRDAQIPGVTIVTHPSRRVITNLYTAYQDVAEGGLTRTADLTVGGVTLWAQLDDDAQKYGDGDLKTLIQRPLEAPGSGFSIQPYGPGGGVTKRCDGTEKVSDSDTRESKPGACWWKYPRSSAGQADHVYPFRATATWTVYYRDGQGVHVLGHYTKYADLPQRVEDVQVIGVN